MRENVNICKPYNENEMKTLVFFLMLFLTVSVNLPITAAGIFNTKIQHTDWKRKFDS